MKTPDTNWVQTALAEFEKPLIRYAVHITGDLERAREVVQDTFLKLCRQKPAQIRNHLAQWLYIVCRNRALDVLRKERRMTGICDAQLKLQSHSQPEISASLEDEEQLSEVLTILSTLPANQQEVIRLKFQSDLSYTEISRITNRSVSNVGFLMHTGLKAIRERVRTQPAINELMRRTATKTHEEHESAGSDFSNQTKNAALNKASTANHDMSLPMSGVAQKVEINPSKEQLLHASASSSGSVLNGKKVAELPLTNRNTQDLIKVMSGTMMADATIFNANASSFSGVAAGDVNTQRSGITVNDVRYPHRMLPPRSHKGERSWPLLQLPQANFNTEAYAAISDNPFLDTAQNPLSTFSIDADTASYSNVRRFLDDGALPPKDAVRIEELVNYFDYDYKGPTDGKPFAVNFELTDAPWKPEHRLLRIGIKGRERGQGHRQAWLSPGIYPLDPPRYFHFFLVFKPKMGRPSVRPYTSGSIKARMGA